MAPFIIPTTGTERLPAFVVKSNSGLLRLGLLPCPEIDPASLWSQLAFSIAPSTARPRSEYGPCLDLIGLSPHTWFWCHFSSLAEPYRSQLHRPRSKIFVFMTHPPPPQFGNLFLDLKKSFPDAGDRWPTPVEFYRGYRGCATVLSIGIGRDGIGLTGDDRTNTQPDIARLIFKDW